MQQATIVLVDDEPANGEYMTRILSNYRVRSFTDPRAAFEFCSSTDFDILIADQKMPYLTGIDLATRLREVHSSHLAIIVSGYTDSDDLVDAVNSNVIHKYIVKPFSADVLLRHVRGAEDALRIERDRLSVESLLTETNAKLLQENERLRGDGRSVLDSFVGHDPVVTELKRLVAQYALSDRPVLISGETGTGKELLARAIHALSPRHQKPFIAINAASVPESLFESELFGYKRGAFAGADSQKSGIVALAHGGTLFLDEVGELPTQAQSKLLRVLQFGTFFPVGGTVEETVDVRMISATNRDLRNPDGYPFRRDLFYRIATLELQIPPLRERTGDILPLFRSIAASRSLIIPELSEEAAAVLGSHPFPGNVRELEGAVERLSLHCAAHGLPVISGSLMREALGGRGVALSPARAALGRAEVPPRAPVAAPAGSGLRARIEAIERDMIEDALRSNGANLSKAARSLGLSRQGLRNKMARYNISREMLP